MSITCPFCDPPRAPYGGMTISFLATDLCPEHLEQSGIPEYERRHPLVGNERPCNGACGCVTLDQMRVTLDEAAV